MVKIRQMRTNSKKDCYEMNNLLEEQPRGYLEDQYRASIQELAW